MCTVRAERSASSTLAWGRLYGIVLATIALGVAVDALVPARTWHRLVEASVVIAGFGAMLVWLRSNRVALRVADTCDCAVEHVRIRVVESRPPTPPRLGREIEEPALVEASG